MISYRKIGGMHWLAIGRLRLAWCVKRRPLLRPLPLRLPHTSEWPNFTTNRNNFGITQR